VLRQPSGHKRPTPRPHVVFTPRRHTPPTLVTKGRVHHEYTNEEGGCRRCDHQPVGCGCCSLGHGAGCLDAKCLGTERLGAWCRRHDEDIGRFELPGDRGSGMLDERCAVLGRDGGWRSYLREDGGDLSRRRSAGHGLARRLPNERGNGRSGMPRGAVRQRRLDSLTHTSGTVTQIPASLWTESVPRETKQEVVGRAVDRLAPSFPGYGTAHSRFALPCRPVTPRRFTGS